ncbi:unnamed protein product [Durusdinium trenchii]|uniref:Uncharacterized protein n=1 Tax=Durusdinium trenchii TaxID=1381693 RepID=A0ABP0P5D4_9DINO
MALPGLGGCPWAPGQPPAAADGIFAALGCNPKLGGCPANLPVPAPTTAGSSCPAGSVTVQKASSIVLQAAPVISRAPTNTAAKPEKRAALAKSQTVGSLLSAYDDDSHDEAEPSEPPNVEPSEPPKAPKAVPTVETRSWSNWEDMLEPRRRHGIVMGKQPEDLLTGWPEQWELKKTWLEDDSQEADGRSDRRGDPFGWPAESPCECGQIRVPISQIEGFIKGGRFFW